MLSTSFFDQIGEFVKNPVFLSAVSSWFITQFTKTLISILRRRVGSVREIIELLIWRTGGMPSSHSALVISVTTAIGFHSGVQSDVFVLALCLSMVVIRDAMGVRRSSGIQAKTLNSLGNEISRKIGINYSPVKEIQGHKPVEVVCGALMGFFIGVAFSVL
ncbi:MAG: divergent PAP2 family protein [Spirochaetes bacterium]|uniref:Divergent PAP2 family protein n=1 Tax=Candidatus Gallitreponema excrementavium TaxID=2840840 RepID=A0A9D9N1V0_9SPIR|nr:divergent PAP2 family protein [Candidatus Gallitreponema excrementavium]